MIHEESDDDDGMVQQTPRAMLQVARVANEPIDLSYLRSVVEKHLLYRGRLPYVARKLNEVEIDMRTHGIYR